MTNETAPERIWFNGGLIDIHMYTSLREFAGGTEYVRADAFKAAQARIAELEQHIADMIDDSGQECACGYDNPTDICLGHLPMYRKTQARIAELEADCSRLNEGIEAIRQFGSDTLSGPTDSSHDTRDWQRAAVKVMTWRARLLLNGYDWDAGDEEDTPSARAALEGKGYPANQDSRGTDQQ